MNISAISEVYNMDCVAGMREYPDNYFDLAICDPPYGIGFSDYERGKSSEKTRKRYTSDGKKKWDNTVPLVEYFTELFRVSKNQIIWGGITLICRQQKDLFFGIKNNLSIILPMVNLRGLHLIALPVVLNLLIMVILILKIHDYTQHKNPLNFTNGF